ncbi:MAG: efflux RND transporter permease subunit, partial [Armatimonadetes bacterium]|nr:efflux RND transporter permease subunit [Armatimonadota bacterium]
MQWLAQLCVRRPVLASVIVMTLTFLGAFSYFRLNVERWPNIDFPFVVVSVRQPGASPQEIESEITDKIEAAVNTISGIDRLTSTSAEGFAFIGIQFVLEKDVEVAAQEVRDKIAGILPDLPSGIDPPVVSKIDPGAIPVLTLAVSAPLPLRGITEYADKVIRPRLEGTPGVGEVGIVGGRARQITAWVDAARLLAYGLNTTALIQALQTQNVQIPAGSVDQGTQRLTLRTLGRVTSLDELRNLVITTRNGVSITVGDVARVEDGSKEVETTANLNNTEAVLLLIRKQSGSNTLNVVRDVKARLRAIERSLAPGYRLQIVRDQSVFIEASTHAVQEHLIVGSFLAALVVLLFLGNWRSTVIAAIAIPTSLISTYALLAAMGLTLNMITLLALALVVGIVIDDAIVVLENIYRFIQAKGMPPFQAAIDATREIGAAVSATTLSLIAVFLPLAFMSGIVGRFMRSFGYTMSFAIAVSLLVSFTLTPMLSARWIRRTGAGGGGEGAGGEGAGGEGGHASGGGHSAGTGDHGPGRHSSGGSGGRGLLARLWGVMEAIHKRTEATYAGVLRVALRRRWVLVVLSLVTLVSIVPLGVMVNKNFLPEDDASEYEVVVRAPEGLNLEATQRLGLRMAEDIRRLPGIRYTILTVGDDAFRTANRFTIYVRMVDVHERTFGQPEAMARVRNGILPRYAYLGLRTQVARASEFGGSGGFQPVEYVIGGPDLDVLTRAAEFGEKTLRQIPGVVDVKSSVVSGKPQLGITIDRARAADLGVTAFDVASALRVLVAGQKVSTYAEGGQQYDVQVRAEPAYRESLEGLSQLTVASAKLGAVPLEHVVRVSPGTMPSQIERFNRRRQVTLTANLLPGTSQAAVLQQLDKAVRGLNLGPDYAMAFAGQAAEQGRQAQAFMTAFLLSFVFMYLVLAAQFESWVHPITILLSLPLTVPFALIS